MHYPLSYWIAEIRDVLSLDDLKVSNATRLIQAPYENIFGISKRSMIPLIPQNAKSLGYGILQRMHFYQRIQSYTGFSPIPSLFAKLMYFGLVFKREVKGADDSMLITVGHMPTMRKLLAFEIPFSFTRRSEVDTRGCIYKIGKVSRTDVHEMLSNLCRISMVEDLIEDGELTATTTEVIDFCDAWADIMVTELPPDVVIGSGIGIESE